MVSFLAESNDEQDGAEPANGPSTTPDDHIKAVQAELEAYLSKLASDKSVNQLMWWNMCSVAICFPSMVVNIVPWECLFNTSGIIANDLCSALSPQSVNARHAASLQRVERLVARCSRDDAEEPAQLLT